MERLVTTAQAAQILGLSLQGVHYRIKKNQLKSIKKAGKTFVYVNDSSPFLNSTVEIQDTAFDNIKEIVKAKDEQIITLKKSIKWMRKQYVSEINRLEKNQKRIIKVFNREIELLQSAFNEMRSIYKPQLERLNNSEIRDTKQKFISIQDFSIFLKRHNKSGNDIKLIIIKALQNGDRRFIYNKKDKRLLILNEDFSDLV